MKISKTLTKKEKKIIKALAERQGLLVSKINLKDLLFDKQREFVDDPCRYKSILGTRRIGKTTLASVDLYSFADTNQKAQCLFIGLTRENAKNLIWDELLALNEKMGNKAKVDHTALTLTFPNKAKIKLAGADKIKDLEKLRGKPYKLIYIDESASYPQKIIDYLFQEVLQPALIDHLGTICMLGTPSSRLKGTFYDITTGKLKGWNVYKWTGFDNPYVAKNWGPELKKIKEMNHWTDQTPKFMREYLGLWAADESDFIYPFHPQRNIYQELPAETAWHYILSMDVGWHDSTVVSVLAYHEYSDEIWVIETIKQPKLIVSEMAKLLKSKYDQYDPDVVVMDTGGLGKAISEEFKRRYQIPVISAEKTEKNAFIALLASHMSAGKVKVKENNPVIQEWQELVWDKNGKEDPGCENDACDTILYGFRHAHTYLFKKKNERAEKNTAQYWKEEAERMEQEELERFEQEQNKEWWEDL